jgi:hypothetical protein
MMRFRRQYMANIDHRCNSIMTSCGSLGTVGCIAEGVTALRVRYQQWQQAGAPATIALLRLV